jgi:hypothetical protein
LGKILKNYLITLSRKGNKETAKKGSESADKTAKPKTAQKYPFTSLLG